MLESIFVLPLAAGIMSAVLALTAVAVLPRVGRRDPTFVALNVSISAWCLSYAVHLHTRGPAEPATGAAGPWAFALFAVQIIGLSFTPVYWFLHAARRAERRRWLKGWRAVLVHVPAVYTIAVALTNPWHGLFARQTVPGAPTAYGSLAIVHHLTTFLLVAPGIWLLVSSSSQRDAAPRDRRRASLLGAAALLPLAGGILWSLRHLLGLDIPVNPVPVLFSLLTMLLLYQVIAQGLDGLVPLAAAEAFRSMSDAAVVTDDRGVVIETNGVCRRLLPEAVRGVPLWEAVPALGAHVRTCLSLSETTVAFELEHEGAVFYGRANPVKGPRGDVLGCSVLLTDITDLRAAQHELERAVGEERALDPSARTA
ncbi:MAG: PAS domain-containing protein [Coriobacteriia bacterium]|nr:PAS domain-containing protein [Coriobacteriia bacterium]